MIKPRHLSGFPSYLSGAGSLGSGRSLGNGGGTFQLERVGWLKLKKLET